MGKANFTDDFRRDAAAQITEREITTPEERKIELGEAIKNCGRKLPKYDERFRSSSESLENLQKLGRSKLRSGAD